MYQNKDDAINIVALAKFVYRINDLIEDRCCAKCNTKLNWYYGENECYLINCPKCETKTIVHADNPQKALDKVGVEKSNTCKYCMKIIPKGHFCCKRCWKKFEE